MLETIFAFALGILIGWCGRSVYRVRPSGLEFSDRQLDNIRRRQAMRGDP